MPSPRPPWPPPHPQSPTLAPPTARQCSIFTDEAEHEALVAVACFGTTAISLLARMSKWMAVLGSGLASHSLSHSLSHSSRSAAELLGSSLFKYAFPAFLQPGSSS